MEERENKYRRTNCRLCYTYNNKRPPFLALPRLTYDQSPSTFPVWPGIISPNTSSSIPKRILLKTFSPSCKPCSLSVSCIARAPCCCASGLPWVVHIRLVCTHTPQFQLTDVSVWDLPVLRKQRQVHGSTAMVNSERTMRGCPWCGFPIPPRSTDTLWWRVSKLRNYPPVSNSPLPVKWGTDDIYLLNNSHMNTFNWICIQLCSTHLHQIYLWKTALWGRKAGNSQSGYLPPHGPHYTGLAHCCILS